MSCGVGVIGAGVVGGGVVRTLLDSHKRASDVAGAAIALRHVAEVNQDRLNEFELGGVAVSRSADDLIADPQVQVVCELIGGIEPAKTFILKALSAGKHVVTANKMLLAKHGPELSEVALKHGVDLRFEAAVAGGIPIIKAIRESLAANQIHAVYGILNGTCNYILTRMTEDGMRFEDALSLAQEHGFAETPPDLDIGGHDAAHKCQILASLCYSTRVNLDDIFVEGIQNITKMDVGYARELGYVIKLLAVIRKVDGEIEARVAPTLVSHHMLLASVSNEFNAIWVEGSVSGPTLYYGRGAGRMPTASAVMSDIIDIARCSGGRVAPAFRYTQQIAVRKIDQMEGRYYLRLTTQDHPGVLGKICTVLGQHGVGIASCVQHEEVEHTPAHVVLMTHRTTEARIRAAIHEIDPLSITTEPTHVLRVL